jgi:hypothetical protein
VLLESGLDADGGKRLDTYGPSTSHPKHDVERLKHALGVFKQCLAAKLPLATEKNAPIPVEARSDEVLAAVGELLQVREWHDAEFLRLALGAVAKHQQANALNMHSPESTLAPAWGWLGAMFKLAVLLAMPAALATGIAAATRQDVGVAAVSFYILGLGVMAAKSAAGLGAKKEGSYLAFDRWTRFQVDGAIGVTGAGALEQLRQMAAEGVNVPTLAFDAAHSLQARTLRFMSG